MRGLMWVLAVFALAVGLSLAAHLNNGYAILVFPPYRAELSLNFAILIVLAAFTLGYLLLRLVVHTLRLPLHVHNFRLRRRATGNILATHRTHAPLFRHCTLASRHRQCCDPHHPRPATCITTPIPRSHNLCANRPA